MLLTDIIRQMGEGIRLARNVSGFLGGTSGVEAVNITNGGTGYSNSFAVSFSGGGGSGAAGTATAIGGVIQRVVITAVGTGYTSTPTPVFTAGSGTGGAGTVLMTPLTLDAIKTANLSLAVSPSFLVFFQIANAVHWYRLRAGTDAESSPFIIRPDDYAASTNEKVWELQGPTIFPLKVLTQASPTPLDFDLTALQTITLTGNITFTTTNRGAGKVLRLRIVCDTPARNFTFPGWIFIGGAAPASIAAFKTAHLDLTCYGANDADIVALYHVEP